MIAYELSEGVMMSNPLGSADNVFHEIVVSDTNSLESWASLRVIKACEYVGQWLSKPFLRAFLPSPRPGLFLQDG